MNRSERSVRRSALAVTLLLAMGATGGTQNVRIVGVDKSFTDWDALKVEVQK